MYFVPEHLAKLKLVSGQPESWGGHRLHSFAKQVIDLETWPNIGRELDDFLPDERANREGVAKLIFEPSHSGLLCAVAILGWGGMNRRHGQKLFKKAADWLPLVEKMRSRQFDRREAYEAFSAIRNSSLPGMGPAYFTKLIYFLTQQSTKPGYIMDQWTARSANLLLGSEVIYMTRSGVNKYVNDNNTADNYEIFCTFVEHLAGELGLEHPDQAELRIFSEGRGRGVWRNYCRTYG